MAMRYRAIIVNSTVLSSQIYLFLLVCQGLEFQLAQLLFQNVDEGAVLDPIEDVLHVGIKETVVVHKGDGLPQEVPDLGDGGGGLQRLEELHGLEGHVNLNGDDILNMSFPVMEKEKSKSIIFILETIEKSLAVNKCLQRSYSTQKSHLLKQMFI